MVALRSAQQTTLKVTVAALIADQPELDTVLLNRPFGCGISVALDKCDCPREFKPVCGSDGLTYNTQCRLLCDSKSSQSLKVVYNGTCCPNNFCPDDGEGVCDSHGNSYANECQFRYNACVKMKTEGIILELVAYSSCDALLKKSNEEVLDDPFLDLPSDQSIDRSISQLIDCDNDDSNDSFGERQKPLVQNRDFGGNAVQNSLRNSSASTAPPTATISNSSLLTIVMQKCNVSCPKKYRPVCDNRARTHPNRCAFDSENCRLQMLGYEEIRIVQDGPCYKGPPLDSSTTAPSIIEDSSQDLEDQLAANAFKKRTNGVNCSSVDCPKNFLPVCGFNRNTYPNRCILQYASCLSIKAGSLPILVDYEGPCKPRSGEGTPSPATSRRTRAHTFPRIASTTTTEGQQPTTLVPSLKVFSVGEVKTKIIKQSTAPPLPFQSSALIDDSAAIDVSGEKVGQVETETDESAACRTECAKIYQPLCTVDNRTLESHCVFFRENCERQHVGKPPLQKAFDGPCHVDKAAIVENAAAINSTGLVAKVEQESAISHCDRDCSGAGFSPVCDKLGHQYTNKCVFVQMNCLSERLKGLKLEIDHEGPC